mgnify:CR=1 FL=1
MALQFIRHRVRNFDIMCNMKLSNVQCLSGMTLSKVIVSICKKEFSAGVLYTACSRFTDITGLAIQGYEDTANCFPKIQR